MSALADYKRIVSYIYDYENGTKKENIGFARVEARNGQCKITIHIKAPSVNNQILKTYIFYRKQGRIEPILLGDMRVRNGMGDFRTITRMEDIMEIGVPLDEMGGIIVYYNDDKFYASEWDDEPIRLSDIHKEDNKEEIVKKEINEEIKENEEVMDEISEEVISEIKEANQVKETMTVPQVEEAILLESSIEEISEENEEIAEEVEETILKETVQKIALEPYEESLKEEVEQFDKILEKDVEVEEKRKEQEIDIIGSKKTRCSPLAERIFNRYMKMFPFEDKRIVDCVRIEPQDIGAFPMEHWVLGNNSFLLHGYYNYRHLIFGRRIEDNKSKYFIGVPGVYENREMSMAKLFGFEQFQPINEREELNGEFGYWYQVIHL